MLWLPVEVEICNFNKFSNISSYPQPPHEMITSNLTFAQLPSQDTSKPKRESHLASMLQRLTILNNAILQLPNATAHSHQWVSSPADWAATTDRQCESSWLTWVSLCCCDKLNILSIWFHNHRVKERRVKLSLLTRKLFFAPVETSGISRVVQRSCSQQRELLGHVHFPFSSIRKFRWGTEDALAALVCPVRRIRTWESVYLCTKQHKKSYCRSDWVQRSKGMKQRSTR